MGDATKISWANRTFNPWIGCSEAGPGCDHCYARTMMQDRFHRVEWGPGKPRAITSGANWNKVLRWEKEAAAGGPKWVFCGSLMDVFDNEVPTAWRRNLLDLITNTPHLRWMLLTKRVTNIPKLIPMAWEPEAHPHVGFMITVCNQEEADRDPPRLIHMKLSMGMHWIGLSIEPMLGPVVIPAMWLKHLDFVICGGESGEGARPMHPDWARRLRDDCASAGVPFHFKQWGAWVLCDQDEGELVGFDPEIAEHDCAFDMSAAVRMKSVKDGGHLLDGKEHRAMPTVYAAPPDPIYPPNHAQALGSE